MSSSSRERPFVGRVRELAQVADGLNDALAGRGRLFLITASPGIGKTRLADEITAGVAARGVPVVWGRSWEAGGAPAYWPWLDPLAALGGMVDDATLAHALGDGAAQVTELVPALGRRLPPTTPVAVPADEARFQLWRAVAGLVRRAATPAGLVLVFEDLHSADSVVAGTALLRRARGALAARAAGGHLPRRRGPPRPRRGRGDRPHRTRGDDDRPAPPGHAAADLVRQRVGAVDDAVTARIFESSQGNPLFVEEMTRLFGDAGLEAIAAGVVPSVRDVISQRLDRVAGAARAVLDWPPSPATSSICRCSPPPRASRAPPSRPSSRKRPGSASSPSAGGGHASRTRWSARCSTASSPRRNDRPTTPASGRARGAARGRPRAPLAELAHHALAGPATHLTRAVGFAIAAARRSLELLAHDEALALLMRARAAVTAAGNPPASRVPLLLALAETHIRRGEVAPGRAACCEAAALARAIGDATSVARAALTYGSVFVFGVVDPVLVDMLEEALGAIPVGDSALRARLLARMGVFVVPGRTGRPAR